MAKRIDTISDKQMADLRRRAEKAAPPMFSREAGQAASAQKARADQN